MGDNEEFGFWKRAALILSVIALMAIVGGMDARDAEITARHVAEAHDRKAVRPELCIAQYAAAERWISTRATLACSGPTAVVPAHILSQPVEQ